MVVFGSYERVISWEKRKQYSYDQIIGTYIQFLPHITGASMAKDKKSPSPPLKATFKQCVPLFQFAEKKKVVGKFSFCMKKVPDGQR